MSSSSSTSRLPLASVLPFALTILLGAFLVFQVQPVFSNSVLPWFGGTPAVWTTCMLFFQVLLFAGYLYAHLITTYLKPRGQFLIHAVLMVAAITTLPIQPDDAWKPNGDESPILYLLTLLAINVGLPYFVLSSTGPLVQKWMSYRKADKSVYRLFALSNIGSLAALLSYPFLFETTMSLTSQSIFWSIAFGVYALCQLMLWANLWNVKKPETQVTKAQANATKPSTGQRQIWLLLPAFASVMLLAITNHVCTDVAVIPFLWVVPLSIYLISFIVCFDRPSWYQPRIYAAVLLSLLVLWQILTFVNVAHWLPIELTYNMLVLFLVCMICHGEAARMKPETTYLTQFYLFLSGGGAIGGLFVGLLCPLLFNSYIEYSLGIFASFAISVVMLIAHRSWTQVDFRSDIVKRLRWVGVFGVLMATMMGARSEQRAMIDVDRNFFGSVRIIQFENGRGMVHGTTLHGTQFNEPRNRVATSYFGRDTGVERAIRYKGKQGPIDVCTIGLGVGTIATYGREGDYYEFIEIDPVVEKFARDYFSFLSDSPADVEVKIGDGRLVLERTEQKYDLMVMDAFSSDAVPAHLMTLEAMQLYKRCLKDNGMIVVNVTNRHLEIAPVLHRLALEMGWSSRQIVRFGTKEDATRGSKWVMIAANDSVFDQPEFQGTVMPEVAEIKKKPLFTDQYHNLFSLLKF